MRPPGDYLPSRATSSADPSGGPGRPRSATGGAGNHQQDLALGTGVKGCPGSTSAAMATMARHQSTQCFWSESTREARPSRGKAETSFAIHSSTPKSPDVHASPLTSELSFSTIAFLSIASKSGTLEFFDLVNKAAKEKGDEEMAESISSHRVIIETVRELGFDEGAKRLQGLVLMTTLKDFMDGYSWWDSYVFLQKHPELLSEDAQAF